MTIKPKNSRFAVVASALGVLVLFATTLSFPSQAYAQTQNMLPLLGKDYQGLTKYQPFPFQDKGGSDNRAQKIDDYFSARSMPLAGYGSAFVAAADQCGMDWRLLPAIGVRESSGGKHMMNNNPFGWGSAKIPFADFNEAIKAVAYNLCGLNPDTDQYYKDKTTSEKLWSYNGSVMPQYPQEVINIMDKIDAA